MTDAPAPAPTRQYLAVRFNPWDRRLYTYHNDREPVAVGDNVVVSTDRGPSVVKVETIDLPKPHFDTKPIVGKERPLPAANPETFKETKL